MKLREQQRNERKQAILTCCLDLFIKRGYDSTGIRDIAKQVGMGIGVFFNYFESKEKVYEALVDEAIGSQQYLSQILLEKAEPIQIFEETAKTAFHAFENNPASTKLFLLIMQAFNSEATPESVKKRIEQYDMITAMVPLVQAGQQKGQVKPGNPEALSAAFWGAVQGAAMNMALFPRLSHPQSDWIVDILRSH